MKKQYTVNGETFRTQSDLVGRIREIIGRYKPGMTVDLLDAVFLHSLLSMHPEAEQKIGCGVVSFSVEDNPIYPGQRSRGFRLHRTDGTSTDFSFWECIRPTPHSKKVQRAFRAAIEPDTLAFKQRHFDALQRGVGVCPDTGALITFTSSHVDHKAPGTFDALFSKFLDAEGLRVEDIRVVGAGIDDAYQDRLVDLDLERRWRKFHNTHAVLEVVSATANLSLRKRVQP